MSRIRSLHPGQWTDEAFVSCSPFARLLALGLRNEADDHGIFEWKPLQLKMRLFPADNVDVRALLDELKACRIVAYYETQERPFGIIRNFGKFQSPRRPSYVHPQPETGAVREEFAVNGAASRNDDDPPTAVPDNDDHRSRHCQEQRSRGRGEDKDKKEHVPSLRDEHPDFAAFWTAYPSRGPAANPRKPACRKFTLVVAKGAEPAEIIRGVAAYAERCRSQSIDGTDKVAQAITFLNQERWRDVPRPGSGRRGDAMHPGAGG